MPHTDHYSKLAKSFHWVSALLIIFLLALGLIMVELTSSDFKFELYGLHKSLGVIVLVIIIARLLYASTRSYPAAHPEHKPWEKRLAKIAHIALYVFAFVMPFSGILMSQSYGYPVSVFGWFNFPTLVDKDVVRGENLAMIHLYSGYFLIAMIVLHVTGALKHHFIDKDSTLKRMLLFTK